MNCRNARRAIHQRIDDEITSRDEAALTCHLVGCVACRQLADGLAALRFDLRRIDGLEPLPTAAIRYGNATAARLVPNPKRLLRLGVAAAAAVVAFCMLRPTVPVAPRSEPATASDTRTESVAPSVAVALLAPTDQHYMAVRVPSQSERIHVVWLYPRAEALSPADPQGRGSVDQAPP